MERNGMRTKKMWPHPFYNTPFHPMFNIIPLSLLVCLSQNNKHETSRPYITSEYCPTDIEECLFWHPRVLFFFEDKHTAAIKRHL